MSRDEWDSFIEELSKDHGEGRARYAFNLHPSFSHVMVVLTRSFKRSFLLSNTAIDHATKTHLLLKAAETD